MSDRDPAHFAYIDAVRGYAFLGVLLCHCELCCGNFYLKHLFLGGGYGVHLFFLVSAITLCYSMSARHESHTAHHIKFYLRRLFRIAPLFWFSMVYYWTVPNVIPALWLAQAAPHGVDSSYFVLTALFLHGWDPYTFNSIVPGGWSIAVEMTFYVVFPFCFNLITNLRQAALWVLGGLIFTTFELYLFDQIMSSTILHDVNEAKAISMFRAEWFPSQFAVFLIGIFTYHLLKEPFTRKIYESRFWSCSLFFFCLLVILSVWQGGGSGFVPDPLFIVMALAGIIITLAGNKMLYAVNPFICHLGKLSYSCYLTHFAAIDIILRFLKAALHGYLLNPTNASVMLDTGDGLSNLAVCLLLALATLGLTVIFSTITHHTIENPGIALGKSIIRKINDRNTAWLQARRRPPR